MENKKTSTAIREFDLAWEEFFKDKPKPKNDEEDRKQQEEFHHWYNFVRKQSDTGKTPAEMYKEAYGKEPPESPSEVSRVMNFEWDEDYSEEDSEGIDNLEKELWEMSNEMFDTEVWIKSKGEMKDLSKRELAKTMFGLGFIMHQKVMDQEIKDMEEKIRNNPKFAQKALSKVLKSKNENIKK